MNNENTISLLIRVGKLVDQTDPWKPEKCVHAITTVEARKGRSAFYELWKRLADQIAAPPTASK